MDNDEQPTQPVASGDTSEAMQATNDGLGDGAVQEYDNAEVETTEIEQEYQGNGSETAVDQGDDGEVVTEETTEEVAEVIEQSENPAESDAGDEVVEVSAEEEPSGETSEVVAGASDDEEKISEKKTDEAKETEDKDDEKTETSKKPAVNKWLLIGVIAAVVVIIAVIVTVVLVSSNSNSDANSDNKGGNSANVDSGAEGMATINAGKLSMEYPVDDWAVETSGSVENSVMLTSSDDKYILLTTIGADESMTTKEFAEASMSEYENSDFDIREELKAVTYNGAEWQRAMIYQDGAYATILFNVTGKDYYMVTYATDAIFGKVPDEVETMFKSLKISK